MSNKKDTAKNVGWIGIVVTACTIANEIAINMDAEYTSVIVAGTGFVAALLSWLGYDKAKRIKDSRKKE